MRPLLCLSVFITATATAFPDDNKAVTLFNGKDLSGWEGDAKTWRVEDGAVVGGSLEANVPRNEFR